METPSLYYPKYKTIAGIFQPTPDHIKSEMDDIEDDITKLLVKRVVLKGLNEKHWSSDDKISLEGFIDNPSLHCVIIYLQNDKLKLEFEFPKLENSPDLPTEMYFIVKSNETKDITLANVNECLVTGNLKAPYLDSLRNLLSHVYGPAILQDKLLPRHTVNNISVRMNSFLAKTTGLSQKLRSKDLQLYYPKECVNINVNEGAIDKFTILRFEGVLLEWEEQIRKILNPTADTEGKEINQSLSDEIRKWKLYRVKLAGIQEQFKLKPIKNLCETLRIAKSVYYQDFTIVLNNVDNKMKLSTENYNSLKILEEPCFKAKSAKNLEELPLEFTNLLKLVGEIIENSNNYGNPREATSLLQKVTHVIIEKCSAEVPIEDIFNFKTGESKEKLKKIRDCCINWKDTYQKELGSLRHGVNSDEVFVYINCLMEHCEDLSEVCTSVVHFGRWNDNFQTPLSDIPGARANKIKEELKLIEKDFEIALKKLGEQKHQALNVYNNDWFEYSQSFKSEIHSLEMRIENLIRNNFTEINTVEESIDIMTIFQHLQERPVIGKLLSDKISDTYRHFEFEIRETKKIITGHNNDMGNGRPKLASTVTWLDSLVSRLNRKWEKLRCAKWLPIYENQKETELIFKVFVKEVNDEKRQLHKTWIEYAEKTLPFKMDIPILNKSLIISGMIEVNIDRPTDHFEKYSKRNQQTGARPPLEYSSYRQ